MNFNVYRQKIVFVFIVLALSFVFTDTTMAQSGTTSVRGTVFDQQGKVVSGATVVLSNAEKGFSRTTVTSETGAFAFPSIQPGIYRVRVESGGFKKLIRSDISALVDTTTEIPVVLEVGSIDETVNVQSGTAEGLLNTQDATIGTPFDSTQVTQLPTDARDVINLLTLQSGVTRFGYVAGGRSDQANITLDGIDVNDAIFNGIFTPVLRLNAEAIEEFRVTTTNPNAAQGRSSGAQISVVTKGGTNALRGALFLTGRRTGWTANEFFNNRDGVERPKLDRNIFGGAIGGPISKNRAFFFYSYEGERTTDGQTVVRVVPLPSLGQGTVRYRNTAGQITSLTCAQIMTAFINTQGCNPAALSVFAAAASTYPANSFDIGDSTANVPFNTAGFRFNADNEIKKNSHVLRLDFNLNAKQQLFFRGNYIDDLQTTAPQFPDTPVPSTWSHPKGFVIGHNWTLKSNVFNNFRFGLSRDGTTELGDSGDNSVTFANVYSPRLNNRPTSFAVDPVHNITDDISWLWRTHTFQFGTNIRLIRSRVQAFAGALDAATVNSGFYPGDGNSITNRLNNLGYQIRSDQIRNVQNAVAAVVGRYSYYVARFTFFRDGVLQPAGSPRDREFRSEAYDFYFQDVWRLVPTLTITAGLRYDLSRPVYEAGGYEVKPNIGLGEFFQRRVEGAANGTPYNQLLVFDVGGPANGRSPLYKWDKNNVQPRIAAAWSPNFKKRLGWLFGSNNESVIRGGFAVTNDYLTPILVARYDANNFLGFSSTSEIPLYFYNLNSTNPGPLFTGFNQNIRSLPNLLVPTGNLTFPIQPQAQAPAEPTAIEIGFDNDRVSPISYSWNLTYERTLPHGLIVSASYFGRKARNLLQVRDAAAVANFVDTQSGTDWHTAATQLEIQRQHGVPILQVPQIAYFANLFPANLSSLLGCNPSYNQTQTVYSLVVGGAGSCGANDWTTAQLNLSLLSSRFPGEHIFYQPQFGSYAAWSSIGRSDYQGLTFTVRQRMGTRLTMDANYTFSSSKDDGSGLQSTNIYSGVGYAINPFRQEDMYAASDFDMRHIINANAIFKLPVGRGEPIFGSINKFADVFLGGWQLTGIFRNNSGTPISAPVERNRWTTNWTIVSYATRSGDVQTCPTRGGSLFGCNTSEAYRGFRNAYPGETGERNIFRLPGFWVLDIGLGKTFDLPREGHKFQVRWEVFNIANTQKMGAINLTDYRVELDPQNSTQAPAKFSSFTAIQGQPRSMQFVFRYTF